MLAARFRRNIVINGRAFGGHLFWGVINNVCGNEMAIIKEASSLVNGELLFCI